MKRIFLTLMLLFSITLSINSMRYDEARKQAWFLTDKMAYELNLTPDQYDRAYEINLDYLMSLRSPSDCSGVYWRYRDNDFRCILFDWQYNLFRTLDYFFRPVRWVRSSWYYPIVHRYRVGYYYFDRPAIYVKYRGRGWRRRSHNDPSPYFGIHFDRGHGMRDYYHNGHNYRPSRPNYGHKPNRPHKPGKPNKPDWADRPHKPGKPNRPDWTDRPHKPGKPGRPEKPNKPNNPGRPVIPIKPARPVKPEFTPISPNKPDRGHRPSRDNNASRYPNRNFKDRRDGKFSEMNKRDRFSNSQNERNSFKRSERALSPSRNQKQIMRESSRRSSHNSQSNVSRNRRSFD